MRIGAGKLDRRLEILASAATQNDWGQPVEAWATIASTYGQRLELRTSDVTRTEGRDALTTGRYLIRYRTGLETAARVRVDGKEYAITSIEEPDRRETLIITLEAI